MDLVCAVEPALALELLLLTPSALSMDDRLSLPRPPSLLSLPLLPLPLPLPTALVVLV